MFRLVLYGAHSEFTTAFANPSRNRTAWQSTWILWNPADPNPHPTWGASLGHVGPIALRPMHVPRAWGRGSKVWPT